MRTESLQVAETLEDLAGLPVGSRILTAADIVMELDIIEEGRKDSGTTYWIPAGTLQPFPNGRQSWLPAIVLPAKDGE